MKRGLRFLLFLVVAITIATGAVFAADPPITLELDGKVIETEVPPIIISGRTMAPAKFLFEAMGGTVEWFEATRQVKISMEETTVLLTIDSKTAQVNGKDVIMDVPPIIKDRRTLIPTSFVAQQLGFTVNWVNETRTVQILSPVPIVRTKILAVGTEKLDADTYRIIVEADGEIKDYKGMFYDAPNRYVLDLKDAELTMTAAGEEVSIQADNHVFSTVRYAQFETSTARVVADLTSAATVELSLSADRTMLYVDLKVKEGQSAGDNGGMGNNGNSGNAGNVNPGDPGIINGLDIPMLDEAMRDKLIIIDPGHGGTDSGSLGYDSNKKIIQMEKDLNLPIAQRLNELLKAAGASTYMLRDGDTAIALYDRPAKANELNAFFYVSVHNNSNESAAPSGTETHYYNKPSETGYGFSSKQIAESVQAELVNSLGLKNRGAKSSPSLAVLNKTTMPAIIIEGAFLSNPTELSYMMTDQFREAYAVGAARGIIKAMNDIAAAN